VPERDTYKDKRSFDTTPEPAAETGGDVDPGSAPAGESFVIQQHYATRLHFDLRLEMMNGDTPVLVSWAIPRNLPLRKGEPRLAVHVEDHPLEYATFSGTIPKGNYGAGEVRIFDSGTYEVLEQAPGKLTVRLSGERMRGVWHLNRTRSGDGKDEWLAILSSDERPQREPLPQPVPMLATLTRDPFDREGWLFEPKWDGVRTIAVCADATALFSRTGRDNTAAYPELDKLHDRLVAIEAIVDGEIVSFDGGKPSFERLQARINLQNRRDIEKMAATNPVTFVAFDLIYLDGRSLVDKPLAERRALLDELVVPSSRLQVSPYVEEKGIALFDSAAERGLEGIVAKRATSPYRAGKRSKDWLKIKVVHEADVVVGGWSPGEGGRSSSFGAVLVGAYEGSDLVFLGAVGTGYTEKSLNALVPALKELETDECPFAADPTGSRSGSFGKPLRNPRWVHPVLVARVEFREVTTANKLRAPSFKGLRADKAAEDCRVSDLRPARTL
jgi:bifunctional non-homologous end joining protein LigD